MHSGSLIEADSKLNHAGNGFSSFVPSVRPSRKLYRTLTDDIAAASKALSAFGSIRDGPKALETIVDAVQLSGLPTMPTLTTSASKDIGQGNQFAVRKECIIVNKDGGCHVQYVAVKRAKFDLDPDRQIDLSDPKWSCNLHDIYLEVIALTMPGLRNHQNITQLLAVTTDSTSDRFHQTPALIMELAYTNLFKLVSDLLEEPSFDQKHLVCHDIAAGLDCIHENGLLHGDLKPQNVLIFVERGRYVAKLADFGLSASEVESQQEVFLGGTPGWTAPEISFDHALGTQELLQADNCSFGLLIWSIIFRRATTPPSLPFEEIQQMVRSDFERSIPEVDLVAFYTLGDAAQKLLRKNPHDRPRILNGLLGRVPQVRINFPPEVLDYQAEIRKPQAGRPTHTRFKYFEWEAAPLSKGFCKALYKRYLRDQDAFTADTLALLFLNLSCPPYLHMQPPEPKDTRDIDSSALEVLYRAAQKGSVTAQSVILPAFRYFDSSLPPEFTRYAGQWVDNALSLGASTTIDLLDGSDLARLERIRDTFRAQGGYNQFYDRFTRNSLTLGPEYVSQVIDQPYSSLHSSAAYGSAEDLSDQLRATAYSNIDEMTDVNETSLYLACVRGEWPLVKMLLQNGASPTLRCTPFKITCLHWTFAFKAETQSTTTTALLTHGADIDAKAAEVVPFPHYPFYLPAGSPLHWAVVLQRRDAINVLVKQGANALLRDGSDPYRNDFRVRMLNLVGDIPDYPFSVSEQPTLGLSPLDYAAMLHEPSIFELLLSMGQKVDVNAADEEGFAVLHRLSAPVIHVTRLGVEYNIRAFQGGVSERRIKLNRTIAAILALGGNLEQLTLGSSLKSPASQLYSEYPRYTPLMLAIKNGSIEVARELLIAGASVHSRNEQGETALFCPPFTGILAYQAVELLCEYGIDVNSVDQHGQTAITALMSAKSWSAIEFLLAAGIDIDSRVRDPEDFNVGHSIFSWIINGVGYRNPEEWTQKDKAITRMLERYVLACPDERKRWRVMNVGCEGETTLMYTFAHYGLGRGVKTLLDQGIAADGLSKMKFERRTDDGHSAPTFRTPLEGALKGKKERADLMEKNRKWSANDFEAFCSGFDTVIDLLRSSQNRASRCHKCQRYSECADCFDLQWSEYEGKG